MNPSAACSGEASLRGADEAEEARRAGEARQIRRVRAAEAREDRHAEACRRGGVKPSKAIFVGDSWSADVEGSRSAGLYPIWIRRGAAALPLTHQPNVPTIQSLDELPGTIDALTSLATYSL